MQEENREGISGALKTLAAVVIVFLLLAALYVGYQAKESLDALVRYFQTVNVRITDMEITRNNDEQKNPCVVLTLQMNPTVSLDGVIRGIYHLPGISSVEEL